MFEISYENTIQHRYMIISEESVEIEPSFRIRMLMQNRIAHILSVHMQYEDERRLFYYDVTGMQSLEDVIEKEYLSYNQLKQILMQIVDGIRASNEYMLVIDCFILQPEYIFIERETKELYLCYYEGKKEELTTRLHELSSVLLNHIDYKDEQAVFIGYQFYQITNQQHIMIEEIKEELEGGKLLGTSKPDGIVLEEPYSKNVLSAHEKNIDRKNIKRQNIKNDTKTKDNKVVLLVNKSKSWLTIFYTAITVFLCIGVFVFAKYTGVLNYPYGNRLDMKKVFCLVVVVGLIESILLVKLFEKKSQIEESVEKEVEEKECLCIPEQSIYSQMQTTVLNQPCYMLQPCDVLGEPILITKFPFVIGSLAGKVDGILCDQAVSRVHAKLEQDKMMIYIEDLQSTNGTYINEQAIMQQQKYPLQPGDTLQLGNHKYRFLRQVG